MATGVEARPGAGAGRPGLRRWSVLLVLPLLLVCSDDPVDPEPTPEPGVVTLFLSGPGEVAGALLEVRGPVETVEAGGYELAWAVVDGRTRILVEGPLSADVVARLRVPDVNRLASYTATVVQLAATDSWELVSTVPWALQVRP